MKILDYSTVFFLSPETIIKTDDTKTQSEMFGLFSHFLISPFTVLLTFFAKNRKKHIVTPYS